MAQPAERTGMMESGASRFCFSCVHLWSAISLKFPAWAAWKRAEVGFLCSCYTVGCLVELTHFVVVPERRRVFINGRVVGRFKTEQVGLGWVAGRCVRCDS